MTTVPLSDHRRPPVRRGSALIMVIFLITMLGMIVYAMHHIVKHDADLAIAQKQAFRARQVAEMGINWAMNPALKPYDQKYLEQTLEDGSHFKAKIRGEGGRMNINALLQQGEQVRPFMTSLFRLWYPAEDREVNDKADALFDMLVDWTDTGADKHLKGWEKEDYAVVYGENTPYPFNRPFYNLDEMLLVPGFDEIVANVPDWRDYFTIYSQGKVDVNAAEAKVLAAVAVAIDNPGDPQAEFARLMEPEGGAHTAVALRWGDDETEDTQDDQPLQDITELTGMLGLPAPNADPGDPKGYAVSMLFGMNDQTTHIECVATVGDYRKRVVLIVRGRTGQPQILSREEIPLFQ
jgi:general secretion pathway protein K